MCASRDRIDRLYGPHRWKWLNTTIPANIIGGLSTRIIGYEWDKKAILMLPIPY